MPGIQKYENMNASYNQIPVVNTNQDRSYSNYRGQAGAQKRDVNRDYERDRDSSSGTRGTGQTLH